MKLIQTSFYTSISQALSIIAGLISVKVVATQIGPQGMAFTGQFLNTTSILTLFATGAISSGVVKYLAQYGSNKSQQLSILRTAFWFTVFSSICVAILVLFFAEGLSLVSFKNHEYYIVYIIWGLFLLFTTLSGLMGNMLNGLKEIRILTVVHIAGTIIGLIFTIVLAKTHGVVGVLVAPCLTSCILFLIQFFYVKKYKWFSISDICRFEIDKKMLGLLSAFILMAIVSGLLTPFIQLFIRNRIIAELGFQQAGHWQAVTRISDYYLGFVTSVLAVYYLPRLSELSSRRELRGEVFHGYRIILPVVAALSLGIWLCRHWIIRLLMTQEFGPASELFGIQFLGDFFKIGSWLLAYLMVAKAMKGVYIFTEIGFNILYALLSFFFIKAFGIMGAVYGFALSYAIYWVAVYIIMKYHKII